MSKPTAYQGKRLRPLLASTAQIAAEAQDNAEDKQPLDSDLTAIAALATTAFGRSLLEAANAGALRTLAGIATGQTYTASNVSTDRSYDANATTVDEVADVLGTLIADLRSAGIIL